MVQMLDVAERPERACRPGLVQEEIWDTEGVVLLQLQPRVHSGRNRAQDVFMSRCMAYILPRISVMAPLDTSQATIDTDGRSVKYTSGIPVQLKSCTVDNTKPGLFMEALRKPA